MPNAWPSPCTTITLSLSLSIFTVAGSPEQTAGRSLEMEDIDNIEHKEKGNRQAGWECN
jgi:hypothetical protein